MLVVLDTNVWLKERLLRSASGAALLYALRCLDAKLLLPSSTRREIIAGVGRDGAGGVRNVERGLNIVQSLLGSRPGLELPDEVAFRQAAETRLDEMSDLILPVDVDCEQLERALERVIEHRAPAATTEEFRDCLLWQCVVDAGQDCLFVTADGDFLDKSAKVTVLAPELDEEARGRVKLLPSIADLLGALVTELPQVNVDRIVDAIAPLVEHELESAAATQDWRLDQLTGSKVNLFATESLNTITAVFELEFRVLDGVDLQDAHVEEGIARVTGQCLFSDEAGVTDLQLDRIDLFTPDGERLKGGVAYIRGVSFVVGLPRVPFRVSTPLPGGPPNKRIERTP